MLRKMLCNLFYTLESKEEGYMKSIGRRLSGGEKAKRENLWDWLKSKMERHIFLLHWWVQDS